MSPKTTSCGDFDGTAEVRKRTDYGFDDRFEWTHTDPKIHVSQATLDQASPAGASFFAGTYDLIEACPQRPDWLHAAKREPS